MPLAAAPTASSSFAHMFREHAGEPGRLSANYLDYFAREKDFERLGEPQKLTMFQKMFFGTRTPAKVSLPLKECLGHQEPARLDRAPDVGHSFPIQVVEDHYEIVLRRRNLVGFEVGTHALDRDIPHQGYFLYFLQPVRVCIDSRYNGTPFRSRNGVTARATSEIKHAHSGLNHIGVPAKPGARMFSILG